MGERDAFDMARELERFARDRGFVAPPAHYIVGAFNLRAPNGSAVYSDEAHLWCRACAEALLAKASPLLSENKREDHYVCETDADNEDSCPHCMACGETLAGSISSAGADEELDHYAEYPITSDDEINPRQAVEIAMVLSAAPENKEALALGRAALACLAPAHPDGGTG